MSLAGNGVLPFFEREQMITREELFDLVAPIAIYHRTDVCFKNKAVIAWKKFCKIPAEDLATHSIPLPIEDLDDLSDWAKDTYDQLFWEIVKRHSDCTWEFDKWGAKKVFDVDGEEIFSGDDPGCFPWYETSKLLRDRLDKGC